MIFYHYSIHVRRTDKLAAEAAFHGIDEYMKYVAEYFDKLEMRQEVPVRKVFLASDDPTVLPEAKKKWVFLSWHWCTVMIR